MNYIKNRIFGINFFCYIAHRYHIFVKKYFRAGNSFWLMWHKLCHFGLLLTTQVLTFFRNMLGNRAWPSSKFWMVMKSVLNEITFNPDTESFFWSCPISFFLYLRVSRLLYFMHYFMHYREYVKLGAGIPLKISNF